MKSYQLELTLKYVPGVLKRSRQALIVITDQYNNYILGQKNIYPPGISRFIGGGIESNEPAKQGAIREIAEEIGINVLASDLNGLAKIKCQIHEPTKSYTFTSYLYHLKIQNISQIKASDDLDDLTILTSTQLQELVTKYHNLSNKLVKIKSEGNPFSWFDYGRYFGPVHQIGLTLTQ